MIQQRRRGERCGFYSFAGGRLWKSVFEAVPVRKARWRFASTIRFLAKAIMTGSRVAASRDINLETYAGELGVLSAYEEMEKG